MEKGTRLPGTDVHPLPVHPQMLNPVIYLDHAASTPLDPAVLDAMLPYLRDGFGNPSSVHTPGRRVRHVVEEAREKVAALLGAEPAEVVFTSGASESNNLALHKWRSGGMSGALVTSRLEHKSILKIAETGEGRGMAVRYVEPSACGLTTKDAVSGSLQDAPAMASFMWVNNETGVVNPIAEIAGSCRTAGVALHCDAVQGAGLLSLDVEALGADTIALSAHKIYGPKGAGLLWIRAGTDQEPLILGGPQERGRRGGTENVAAIVGLSTALESAVEHREVRRSHIINLHRRMRRGLAEAVEAPVVFHSADPHGDIAGAPHILSVGFPAAERAVDGEMLLLNLDVEGLCVSGGSACTSGAIEPSHVLLGMGIDRDTAAATIRISFGKENTETEVDTAVEIIAAVVRRMRR